MSESEKAKAPNWDKFIRISNAFPFLGRWFEKKLNEDPLMPEREAAEAASGNFTFEHARLLSALLMILYPKGVRTTDEVGSIAGVSGNLVRRWRGKENFQELCDKLQIEFFHYLVEHIRSRDFLISLFKVLPQFLALSDTVLYLIYVEILNALIVKGSKEYESNPEVLAEEQEYWDETWKLRYIQHWAKVFPGLYHIPFQRDLELPINSDPIYDGLLHDLCYACQTALFFTESRVGRKPREREASQPTELYYAWGLDRRDPLRHSRHAFDALKDKIESGAGKDEVLSLTKMAQDLTEILPWWNLLGVDLAFFRSKAWRVSQRDRGN